MKLSVSVFLLAVSLPLLAGVYVPDEENLPKEVKRAYMKLARAQLKCANKCNGEQKVFDSPEIYENCMKKCSKRKKMRRREEALLSLPQGGVFLPMIQRFHGLLDSDSDEYQ
uniref:Uncharacterized protein n=1 Tax=Trichuris muris TaxID=70415 RepID=A0A5S6QVR3_TRIMR